MGNGDGEIIRPAWSIPRLYDVHLPFSLDGERAVVCRLHAGMFDVDDVRIEVRVDYPERPGRGGTWKQGMRPTGGVFYLPCKLYSRQELIVAIRESHHKSLAEQRRRLVEEAGLNKVRTEKRAEIDELVAQICAQLEEGASH